MAIELLGKNVSQKIDRITKEVMDICTKKPCLSIIKIGDDFGAASYATSIIKKCNSFNIKYQIESFSENENEYDIIDTISRLNNDSSITGILLCKPIPSSFNEAILENCIASEKDVDLKKPCTAQACMEILYYYNIPIAGKHAVVIGRSRTVGRPVAQMLLDEDATVTVCHSKTTNLKAITQEADIIISAIGKPKFITADFVRSGQTIIDVGINTDTNGKICGDVDYETVEPIVDAITPVPKGVGAVTISTLLLNLIYVTVAQNS